MSASRESPGVILVRDPWQYSAMLAAVSSSRVVAVDFETTGLDPLACVPLLLALRGEEGPVFVLEWRGEAPGIVARLLAPKLLIAHNANFEYKFFRTQAGEPEQVPERWYCTQVGEALIQSGLRANADGDDTRVALAEVYWKYCGVRVDKELQTSFVDQDPATFRPTQAQVEYAAQDVMWLHEVARAQWDRLAGEALMPVAQLEMKALPCIAEMELNGLYLNTARHAEVLAGYVATAEVQKAKVYDTLATLYKRRKERENLERAEMFAAIQEQMLALLPGGRKKKDTPEDVMQRVAALRKVRESYKPLDTTLNLGSHAQVWEALAEAGIQLFVQEWDEAEAAYVRRPSLDKTAVKLESEKPGANPVLVEYAAWAKAVKVVSTYGAALAARVSDRDGRVHAEFNQVVNSGRLSSNRPNLQNMPKAIRECFEAEPGRVLISADGKNQEGRIAAALSGDEALLDIFRNDWDWHSMTAAIAYPEKFPDWRAVDKETSVERRGCKNANFSGIYGGVPSTLVARGYVPDLKTAERLFEAKDKLAPRLKAWTLETADHAVEHGFVTTASGRKRYFRLPPKPAYSARDPKPYARWKHARGAVRRAAMNHPVQGTGADIMKQAMVLLRQPLADLGFKLVCMVHDSLVYEGWEETAEEAKAVIEDGFLRAARTFITNLDIPGEAEIMRRWH